MKNILSNILKFSISLGLGVFLIWWVYSKLTPGQIEDIREAFLRANYFYILLGMSLGFFSNYIRALRWKLLLKPMGYEPNIWVTYCSVLVMYMMNLVFPRLGEVSRCAMLNRYEKIPMQKSVGTMVTERVVDLVCVFAMGLILLLFQFNLLSDFFQKTFFPKAENVSQTNLYFKIGFVSLAIFGMAALYIIFTRFAENKWVAKIKEVVMGILEGIVSIKDLEHPWLFVFQSILIWFCYTMMSYIAFFGLSETTGQGIFPAMACTFFGGFAYVAAQGGIGAYPLVVSKVLLLYGVTETYGLAWGWIVWVVQTVMVAIGGIAGLLLLPFFAKKK